MDQIDQNYHRRSLLKHAVAGLIGLSILGKARCDRDAKSDTSPVQKQEKPTSPKTERSKEKEVQKMHQRDSNGKFTEI